MMELAAIVEDIYKLALSVAVVSAAAALGMIVFIIASMVKR